MKTAAYEALIQKLEEKSKHNPQGYQRQLMLLAALGYGYIGLILILLVALVVGLVFVFLNAKGGGGAILKLGLILGAFIWFILQVLFLRLHPPGGRVLQRHEAPRLFDEVADMCHRLQAPAIDEIKVDDAMNACISQVPRFGLLGWPRHYLVLGLPLMAALSAEEMKSVIAHEMGHHSKSHGRFAAWIYRVRQTWYTLVHALQESGHWGVFLFRPFFRWYAPYFGACSFVLARQQEYEADAVAAELTSPAVAAQALQRLNIVAPAVEEQFWKPLFRRAPELAAPPTTIYHDLGQYLRSGVPESSACGHLTKALRERTGFSDTHPSLQDRLQALGQHARVPGPVGESAGMHYLGESFAQLATLFGEHWSASMSRHWDNIAAQEREQRGLYEELRTKAQTTVLNGAEAWKLEPVMNLAWIES